VLAVLVRPGTLRSEPSAPASASASSPVAAEVLAR
jgi:hypothetical protein